MPIVEVPGMGDVEFPDDMSDDDIAVAIRKNLGQPEVARLPEGPAAGGYNPILGRLGGATTAIGEKLGMTPENTRSPIKNAFGPLETALQMGTGAALTPVAGLAGIGQGIKNLVSPGMPAADRVQQIQGMAYQPRTGVGQGMARTAAVPAEIYARGTNYLGEKATDITGSPAIGAAIKTAGDVAPMVVGARSMERPQPRRTGDYISTKNEIPTTEQLTKASKDAYAAGKESGVIVPAEGYAKSLDSVRKMAAEEGINPTLHPKSTAVLKELEAAGGKPLTLQEAETLRKIALDAEDDLNPVTRAPTPDARLAGKIVDQLDESIEALSVNDPARTLWARSRRSQMIDQMVHRAEIKAGAHYTQAGMEHALRQEFKQLALNPRRMRGLTKEQRAAVEKVATGGPVENTLRALGKFDPTTSVVSSLGSLGTAGILGPLTGGASALLPVAGFGARRLATRATSRNVDAAREALVGRGMPNAAPLTRASPTPLSAAPQGSTSRTPIQLQAAMALLEKKAGKLNANDPQQLRSIWQEFERIQAELASGQGK
jgi:hypothetical protein